MNKKKEPDFISDIMHLLDVQEKEFTSEAEFKEFVFKHYPKLFGSDSLLIDANTKILPGYYLVTAGPEDIIKFYLVVIAYSKEEFSKIQIQIQLFLRMLLAQVTNKFFAQMLSDLIMENDELRNKFFKVCKEKDHLGTKAKRCVLPDKIYLITDNTTPEIEKKFEENSFWQDHVNLVIFKRTGE